MTIAYKIVQSLSEALKAASGLATIKTHTVYLPALQRGDVAIDLGANVGTFSTAMAERGLTCHAVEAVPQIYEQIPYSKSIHKYNIAISGSNAPIELFTSDNRECNSIQRAIAGQYGMQGRIKCRGITFETFLKSNHIDRIALLKIDIEGAEEQLFDSTTDDVLQKADQITIEFHDFIKGSISTQKVEALVKRIRSLGFYFLPCSYMYPKMLNADLLFLRHRIKQIGLLQRAYFTALSGLLHFQKAKSQFFAQGE